MRKLVIALLVGTVMALVMLTHSVLGQPGPPPPPPPFNPPTIGPPPPITQETLTPTSVPTAVITLKPIVSATSTPVPLTAAVNVSSSTVSPKKDQTITVKTLPGATVNITVAFPNGDTKTNSGTADTAGNLVYTYTQPGSRITKSSRIAKVTAAVAMTGQNASASASYTISFAGLDVSAKPRSQTRGKTEQINVHTKAQSTVTVQFLHGSKVFTTANVNTPANGWSTVSYNIPSTAAKGKVTVKASAKSGTKNVFGSTSFTIK